MVYISNVLCVDNLNIMSKMSNFLYLKFSQLLLDFLILNELSRYI